jgi:hypothetical protein
MRRFTPDGGAPSRRPWLLHSGIGAGCAGICAGLDTSHAGGPRCRGTGCWRPGSVAGLAALAGRYAAGVARADRWWPVQVEARLSDLGEVGEVSILPLVERATPDGSGLAGEPGVSYLIRAGGMRVLFDSGLSGGKPQSALAHNAQILGTAGRPGRRRGRAAAGRGHVVPGGVTLAHRPWERTPLADRRFSRKDWREKRWEALSAASSEEAAMGIQHTEFGPPARSTRSWSFKILAPLAPVLAVILWLATSVRVVIALLLAFHALVHTGFLTPGPEQNPAPRRGRSAWTAPGSCPGSRSAPG